MRGTQIRDVGFGLTWSGIVLLWRWVACFWSSRDH